MTRIILALTAIACASPAMAQSIYQGTITPYGSSIYGGPPQGYSVQLQQQPTYQTPAFQPYQAPRSMTCTTIGNQTFCD